MDDAVSAPLSATLIYSDLRTAQQRLAAMWHDGLLERTLLPPRHRGGAQLAYRLSRRARTRLGDTSSRRRGSNRIGHTLDIVETVCALAAAEGDVRHRSPVQLWMTEPMAAQHLEGAAYPDRIVVLSTADRSALLCLEVSRGTQRLGVIRAKLSSYRRLAQQRADWQLLFVVPHEIRARWFVSITDDDPVPAVAASVVVLPTLTREGMRAPLVRLDHPGVGGAVMADLLTAGERRIRIPGRHPSLDRTPGRGRRRGDRDFSWGNGFADQEAAAEARHTHQSGWSGLTA